MYVQSSLYCGIWGCNLVKTFAVWVLQLLRVPLTLHCLSTRRIDDHINELSPIAMQILQLERFRKLGINLIVYLIFMF
jgi:hypothetical protein